MEIGLFGGTFDPIHHGHLRAVEEVCEDFELDRGIFIPAYLPPHKDDKPVLPFEHRLAMCRRAVASNPLLRVDDLESERSGKSYSLDTLNDLKTNRPGDRFHFIIGMDAFLDIHTWHGFQELFALSDFIVISRPGYPRGAVEKLLERVSPGFRADPRAGRYIHPSGFHVHFWETTMLDISSTRIRKYIQEGKSIRYLVPEPVIDYIQEHGLYA